jgi:signal transduction histidine kinase
MSREKIIWDTEEHERLRFARDIHDDLGSGLSKINFLSEIIFQKTAHLPDVKKSSEAIKETSIKMIENMRDLIWALNPENTTLDNLIARIREYTTDYIEDFPITLEKSFPDHIPQMAISKESHHEIFMVVKEILNNISKHSKATQLTLSVLIADNNLIINFQENGIGFEASNVTYGNGLKNIKNRLTAIGANLEIINHEGTIINISLSLNEI